jgi:hypothetical protein
MKFLACTAALLLSATTVSAMDTETVMRKFALETVADWLKNPVMVESIRAQNVITATLTADQIISLDNAWRAEVGQNVTPTISHVLDNAASAFLTQRVAASEGRIVEAFTMDARGLNTAASAVTSDYWQGDEDKFQKSFGLGASAVHVSDIELDESSQAYLAQVSVVIVDPVTQMPIGAITIGVNAESF